MRPAAREGGTADTDTLHQQQDGKAGIEEAIDRAGSKESGMARQWSAGSYASGVVSWAGKQLPRPGSFGKMGSWVSGHELSEAELLQESKMQYWSSHRIRLHRMITSNRCDMVIGCVIFFNVIVMLVEADGRAKAFPDEYHDDTILSVNRTFLGIYTVEALIRGFIYRCGYWRDRWNLLDCSIVCIGYLDEVMAFATAASGQEGGAEALSMVPMLRILRIARLARAIRLLRFYPELYVMVKGFIGAMRAMFWGFVLIGLQLMLWSLIGTEIIHPINVDMMVMHPDRANDFCRDSFGSVGRMVLFFFQTLVAGDSWGLCTIPIIEHNFMTFFFFAVALVSVTLGFMNLILAVIVDHASQAREGDKEEQIKNRKEQDRLLMEEWRHLFAQVDSNDDGLLSQDELISCYQDARIRDKLNMMGMDGSDLEVMFEVSEKDPETGCIAYETFLETFIKSGRQNSQTYLMFCKLHLESVGRELKSMRSEVDKLKRTNSQGGMSSPPEEDGGAGREVAVRRRRAGEDGP